MLLVDVLSCPQQLCVRCSSCLPHANVSVWTLDWVA